MWRGTLLHELLNLPVYWQQVAGVQLEPHYREKIHFGHHSRQYCLVLRPDKPVKAWVLYWHGGGWQFGTPEQFSVTARPWLRAGYGVIIPSYRRLPFYQFESIRADTIAALSACRRYWESQGEATSSTIPIILLGMSAGGHIASLVGLDESFRQQAGWGQQSIAGVIAAGAVLDLFPMRYNPIIRILAGSPNSAGFTVANPLTHISADAPPFLVIHGKKDGMAPYRLANNFRDTYRRVATPENLELVVLENGSHLDAGRWMFLSGDLQNKVMQQAESWLN